MGTHSTHNMLVINIIEAGHGTEHDFTVAKFCSVGDTGVRNRHCVCFSREFCEDGVNGSFT